MSSISFVIPTYNAAFHIERCLKSIRAQDYPEGEIQIIISDGGSSDNTLSLARNYHCEILYNAKRLAEYGLQIGVQNATGEFLVPFAADNELVGSGWVKKVINILRADKDISAVWGRLVSAERAPSLNKYFALIQSDPLSWFMNKNLDGYRAESQIYGKDCFIFKVDPQKPLVWGANGIVYRTEKMKAIWSQGGYLGDNDAFQHMVEQGNDKVAYFNTPFVYHHHVATLKDWVSKWRRNYKLHFLDKLKTRNLNWVFIPNFKMRLVLWIIYSLCPVFSGIHSIYLAIKDADIHWLYHPLVSFMQTTVYAYITLATKEGRALCKNIMVNRVSR